MKITSRTCAEYEVTYTNGSGGLALHHYTSDTESFESVVEAIKRAEDQARAKGYDPHDEYLIVSRETKVTYLDGMFFEENTTRRAVAWYHDGIVEDL